MESHIAYDIIKEHSGSLGGMLSVLSGIQTKFGYLPEDALREVAKATGHSLTGIYAMATFYHAFSLKPRGKHLITVCLGTACHVREATQIVDEFERQLGISRGETTADGNFTLETVNCLGACALGPIAVVDGKYYSNVSVAQIKSIIKENRSNGKGYKQNSGETVAPETRYHKQELYLKTEHDLQRVHSVAEFKNLAQDLKVLQPSNISTIVIPSGTCGQASGSNKLVAAAQREIANKNFSATIQIRVTGCHGFCQMEPSILIEPSGTFYPRARAEDMARIIDAVNSNTVLDDLLFVDPATGKHIEKQNDITFFKLQTRAILSRNEKIDPLSIHDYIRNGGYYSFAKVLSKVQPKAVVDEIKASGLRGRGGAGFSTGAKWELLASQPDSRGKFLVCNADEGDPGAYMDRSVLEGNPHSIIEGMLIGAFATGADRGVIYVRSEYPLAIKHLIRALADARSLGLLGGGILGTQFSFTIDLVRGAGAFVCGEETALIRSIEGFMGEPRQRPPFPIQKGIQGKPTAINNVETLANISIIIEKGAKEFARTGTKNNSGTKIFSLVGKVKYTGLVEVPMGMTLKQIIHDIGGGPVDGHTIKAVQTGGPSGGCIPAEQFDLPVDYDSLKNAGSIMGSGGMIVMDNHTCLLDVAKYFTNFLKNESCGKCFTCRKGTQRMYEILDAISAGKGSETQIELLEQLALVVRDTTMCGLGQTAANPVLSTLRYYGDEYAAHIRDKKCPAGVCRHLIRYAITDRCTGCGACRRACPSQAITGIKKAMHVIEAEKCIKCGVCKTTCKFEAIEVL